VDSFFSGTFTLKQVRFNHTIERITLPDMCGRFLLALIPEAYLGLLRIDQTPNFGPDLFAPRMNIAPTQQILIARHNNTESSAGRELAAVRWGMIPPWAGAEDAKRRPVFNARSETLWEKPMFKSAAARRRCVVPASGFYEWRKPQTPRGRKQPFLIERSDSAPMLFAGVWSSWRPKDDPQAEPIECCAIITTAPNAAMAPIHDRMPVILDGAIGADRWLEESQNNQAAFDALLRQEASPAVSVREIDSVPPTYGNHRRPDNNGHTLFG